MVNVWTGAPLSVITLTVKLRSLASTRAS